MAYPTNEGDDDRIVSRIRSSFQPVSSIAVQRETARENESQVLVDRELQLEQIQSQPVVKVQEHPGEDLSVRDNQFRAEMIAVPVKQYNPPKVPMVERSTVSIASRLRMGVPVRSARGMIVPPAFRAYDVERKEWLGSDPEVGLPIKEKKTKKSPVSRLNFIDQFFNWFNALLK